MELSDCKVLLVDDELELLLMTKDLLAKAGYQNIDTATNAADAKIYYKRNEYQLVILDVMLPDQDGFSLFQYWQEQGDERTVPVIFLSARDEDKDRLKGLGLGADDYITKPFLPEELLLRMKAVLRRTCNIQKTDENNMIGDLRVDLEAGLLFRGDEEIELTAKEFTLLKKLMENRGKIISINILMDTLWPDGNFGYENSLMVHIRRLREKLEDNPSNPQYLITVRGLGYKLKK